MFRLRVWLCLIATCCLPVLAAPTIDPIENVSIPAGKSLILPVTASSAGGKALTFSASSSTNRITVELHTNNPFWKISVAQIAPANAPGAYQTPFRGSTVTVTNIGDMTFMLFRDIAPRTVDVFQGLSASGFYNSNTIFHRVISGFMIQGGDPVTNGTGGLSFQYEDEFFPRAIFSGNGQLALANSGKDTDGSQFFITSGPQRYLDFGYTIFGQLLHGFCVLTNVISTQTDANNRPLADVIITKASFAPDYTDAVITLTGTQLTNVSGTITIIADDGAGGRTTNTFTATTVSDSDNAPPFFYPDTVTNRTVAMNVRLTNYIATFDFETNMLGWQVGFYDATSYNAASNSTFSSANGQLVVVPVAGYTGPVRFYAAVSQNGFASYDWRYFNLRPEHQLCRTGSGAILQPTRHDFYQWSSEQPNEQLHRKHQLGRQCDHERRDHEQPHRLEGGSWLAYLH
jgi:cyclophilin family peptidyl-prolyl cis-trans isomerase